MRKKARTDYEHKNTSWLVTRGVREWLSAFPFLPIPISFIPIPVPAKHLFPFPLLSDIDFPIPSHSHSWLPYINDYNFYLEQLIEIVTALSFISHNGVVLATHIRETIFNTIHHCVTEDKNKSYSYSYFIEFTHQTCMKKVHDNVHKRYSDKTVLTIITNLLKIEQAPVNKGTFIGTGSTLG